LRIKKRIEQQVNQVVELVHELKNERSYRGIERLVQLIIQALLDLGVMIISALGGKIPKAYSEIGILLADAGLLSREDAKVLRSMAGMRNILVHAYTAVNRELVLDSAEKLKEDALRIAETLKSHLEGRLLDPLVSNAFREEVSDVFRGRVKAAFLFGGRAKGYSLKGDYDVAVYFGRDHDLYDLGELVVDLAKVLNVDEDRVDVIDLDVAAPELVLEALDGVPLFIEDDYIVFELKVKAILAMLDMQSSVQVYFMG
jgi:uncharacterized protein YutE (UPF0331/DUF86 family)/predicted nucleotidyltransferase